MRESESERFAQVLAGALEIYGESPSPRAVEIWWWALLRFDLEAVRAAFAGHISGPEGKFAPKPAHIIERIEKENPDGRPAADEAWAMVPKDEHASAVLTEEMLHALGVVRDMIGTDPVGARMAFRAAYDRVVADARRNSDPVKWTVSLGFDKLGHSAALRDAVMHKRLSAENAAGRLPPDQRDEFLASVGASHLLAAPADPEKAKAARLQIAGMLARLAKPSGGAAIEPTDESE